MRSASSFDSATRDDAALAPPEVEPPAAPSFDEVELRTRIRMLPSGLPVDEIIAAVAGVLPDTTAVAVQDALAVIEAENEAMRVHIERSVAVAYRELPELARAVPPVAPAPPQAGTFRLSAEQSWAEAVQRGLHLRKGTMEVGPIESVGRCLEPLVPERALKWVDPTLPARDGDVVLVQWDAATLAGIVHRNRDKPAWLAMYGAEPLALACKLLREFQGKYWLMTNNSMLELGNNRILGVLTRVQRPGIASDIDPDAVSQSWNVQDPSTVSYSAVPGIERRPLIFGVVVPDSGPAELTIEVSFEYSGPYSGDGSFSSKRLGLLVNGNPVTGVHFDPANNHSDFVNVALQHSFTVHPGQQVLGGVFAEYPSGSVPMRFRNRVLRAFLRKR